MNNYNEWKIARLERKVAILELLTATRTGHIAGRAQMIKELYEIQQELDSNRSDTLEGGKRETRKGLKVKRIVTVTKPQPPPE